MPLRTVDVKGSIFARHPDTQYLREKKYLKYIILNRVKYVFNPYFYSEF
jgi:hypothetical protein